MVIDESQFSKAWRFNSEDCILSKKDKDRLLFLCSSQSQQLWGELVSPIHSHMMEFDGREIEVVEKTVLDFSSIESGADYLSTKIPQHGLSIIFWGAAAGCIAPNSLIIKAWTDFFYPSDETTVIAFPCSEFRIFSFEETFFFGKLLASEKEQ